MGNWIIAFGPDSESYFFCNKQRAVWKGIPAGLAKILNEDKRFSPDKLYVVSLGPNQAYFVKSTEGYAWADVSPAVETKVREVGGWDTIITVVFSQDPDAYIIMDMKTHLYGNKVPEGFYEAIFRYSFLSITDCALSMDGGYMVCTKDNVMSYKNLPEVFIKAFQRAPVQEVFISPFHPYFVIEYASGDIRYSCPSSWHSTINELYGSIPKTTSGSSTSATSVTSVLGELKTSMKRADGVIEAFNNAADILNMITGDSQ